MMTRRLLFALIAVSFIGFVGMVAASARPARGMAAISGEGSLHIPAIPSCDPFCETNTRTPTVSPTRTRTPTRTHTSLPTQTPTISPTPTETLSPTISPTPTETLTPTITPTLTPTPTCFLTWNTASSPSPGNSYNQLQGVAVLSATDVWAVGYYSNPSSYDQTLMEHWDGSQWSVVPSPNVSGVDNDLVSVSAVTASDIWAVGFTGLSGSTLAEHWNGTSWSIVATPILQSITGLLGVSAISTGDVWAVGYNTGCYCPLAEHWNGTIWSIVPTDTSYPTATANFEAVAAVSSNDVWAVGHYFDTSDKTLVEHWDGTAWALTPSPNPSPANSNRLYGVTVISTNDVWAVGAASSDSSNPLALHWDGASWSSVAIGSFGELRSVWAASPNDVWVVGFNGGYQTVIARWNGTIWSQVPSPNPSPTSDLYGVAGIRADNHVWAVGATGTQSLIERTVDPCAPDAFAHLEPSGPITTTVGAKLTLNLMTNSGTHAAAAQQSYLTFTNSILQVVDAAQQGCLATSAVAPDATTFDAVLQNQVCNDSAPCDFGGLTAPPGSIAFASGALSNPPAQGDFRVARIAFCASVIGDASVHWQFSPPAPTNRGSNIVDENGTDVSNSGLYADLLVRVLPGVIGHVNWQGRPPQPNTLQQLPITLTLKSGATEANFPSQTTDASGFFTTATTLPPGNYNWRVKGPKYLANAGNVTLTGTAITNIEMGLMLTGDANNDNVVNTVDFAILRATFGKASGDPGYDDRADFNGDSRVNVADFNLLKGSFGHGGAPPIGPAGR